MKIDIQADVVRVAGSRQIGEKTKTELHLSYMDGDREQIIPIAHLIHPAILTNNN